MASNGCAGSSPARGTFPSNMNKFAYIIYSITFFLLTSCGVGSGRFKFEGRFLHMNQGEFYAYSPDGGFDGVDTIKVVGGRFSFETACHNPFTIMIVFPNFSQQPVFAEPGKSVDIQADASHLKELTVKGTKTNELMNAFRREILSDTPPEETKHAEQFIKNHPETTVSLFMVRKYFISCQQPNYKKAEELIKLMIKEQPDNVQLQKLQHQVKSLKNAEVGSLLPTFTAYDMEGKLISSASLSSSPVTVISTWTTSLYESMDLQRKLQKQQKEAKGKLKVMGICVDPSKKKCADALKRDSISWPTICNGDMLADKTLQLLGLTAIPDNIVLQNGKIVARSLKKKELFDKLDQLLK